MRRILYILIVASMLLMSMPFPVNAATSNLTVTADGFYTGGSYSGGAGDFTNMQAIDAAIWDAFGPTTGVEYRTWEFTACPVVTVNSVSIYYYARTNVFNGCFAYPMVRIGSTDYVDYGGAGFLTTTYAWYSYTWATNPATGAAWTPDDIDSAEFGVRSVQNGPTGRHGYYDEVYVQVDFVATSPSVTSSAASPVGVTTATLNGSITSLNGDAVQSEGFVWDAVSHTPLASSNVTPGNGYASWWYQNGSYGIGDFSHAVTGLISGQTYYYRACANNTYGWNYGDEITFATIGVPTISTSIATYISPTTAQLNASVTNSNGQACDVRFGYDTVSHAADFAAYPTHTVWVNDTYTTGNLPYVAIVGLVAGTTYYFNVQIENDAGISYGIERTFMSSSGLNHPASLVAIPGSTTMTLKWEKIAGSPLTEIRWSTSTFPNTTADGTLLYLGALSSTTHTGLTAGTNYYYSAWGAGGGLFSADKITCLGTTIAGTVPTTLIPPTSTTSAWVAMPSELGLANLPFYSYVNWAFDAYSLPRATGWVMLYVLLCIFVGMVIYMKAPSNNLLMTGIGIGVLLGVGSIFTPPLIPIWATFVFIIIFATIAWVANKY